MTMAVTMLYYLARRTGNRRRRWERRPTSRRRTKVTRGKMVSRRRRITSKDLRKSRRSFRAKRGFAFAPCWSSWHGVKSIGNSERDTIQGFITIEQLANKELKEYLRTTRRKKKNTFRELWKESCLYRKQTQIPLEWTPPLRKYLRRRRKFCVR